MKQLLNLNRTIYFLTLVILVFICGTSCNSCKSNMKHPSTARDCSSDEFHTTCCGATCFVELGANNNFAPQDGILNYSVITDDSYFKPVAVRFSTDAGDSVVRQDRTNYNNFNMHIKKGSSNIQVLASTMQIRIIQYM